MPLQLLILCHRVPFPLKDGGALVTRNLIEGLVASGAAVDVLSYNTTKHFVDEAAIKSEFHFARNFVTVPLDNRVTPLGAFKNFFSSRSYHIQRFEQPAFIVQLEKLLSSTSYDAIIFDHVFLQFALPTVRKMTASKIYCRIHNIEFEIWHKLANQASGFRKSYIRLQANRLQKEELVALQKFDELLILNPIEQQRLKNFGVQVSTYYLPFTLDTFQYPDTKATITPNAIFHLASMNWLPNQEALDWFLAEVWPKIIKENADVILHIGGLHLPEKYFSMSSKQIKVYKEVDDAASFMLANGISIVPLWSGAGIRIKIMQAMAMGIPIISTSLGADGIPVIDGQHIAIADNATSFASAVLKYVDGKNIFGKNAQLLMRENFNSELVYKNFILHLAQK
jgi:polysaccharide biosynthesis protein PslH